MTILPPFPPDPMPLREALRGLRHVMRRGGESLRDTVPVGSLPEPAQAIAGAVLREVGQIARSVDLVASGLAKRVLGGTAPAAPPLGDGAGGEAAFAAAAYAALRAALRRIGAAETFISEVAARSAYRALGSAGGREAARLGADLTLCLIAARVVREADAAPDARLPGPAIAPVAVFAVVLWMLADRAEHDGEAALDAAIDLSIAIAADIRAAAQAGDAARLTALFAEFADHV